MSNKLLAIDIHEDQVFGLVVKAGFKGMRCDGFASVRLSDAPEGESRFEWGIRQVLESLDTSGAVCLVSIPSGFVSFRNLNVPFTDRRKIRQVLPFELEPMLPYEIEALFIDFIPVSKGRGTGLIAAAVENETLEMFASIFERVGITPRIITAGGMAQAMCIAEKAEKRAESFIYIDADIAGATIFAVASGRVHLVHHVRIPQGMDTAARAARIISHVRRIPAIFESVFESGFTSETLFVSKTPAIEDDLIGLLDQLTELSVRPIDVAKQLLIDSDSGDRADAASVAIDGPLCLAAVELLTAMPVNFSREHYAVSKYWGENKNEIITTAMLGVFVFILMMFTVVLDAHFLQERVDILNKKVVSVFRATFPDEQIVDPVKQMQIALKQMKEKAVYSGESGAGADNIDILNDMSRLVPDNLNVVFTRFVRGDNAVLIAGITDTFNAVDDIKGRLETSRFLKNITISTASMDKTIKRVRFNIKADIVGESSGS